MLIKFYIILLYSIFLMCFEAFEDRPYIHIIYILSPTQTYTQRSLGSLWLLFLSICVKKFDFI